MADFNNLPEFKTVPPSKRQAPGRIKNVPVRLYIERHQEHKDAMDYIAAIQKKYPRQGSKAIVRAILKYQDEVVEKKSPKRPKNFKELNNGGSRTKAKQIALRLAIDRFIEHRKAYRILDTEQRRHGQINDFVTHALLHYQKNHPIGGKTRGR
jgi:hypothetical protein